jgi:hypothetical protein
VPAGGYRVQIALPEQYVVHSLQFNRSAILWLEQN